MNVRYVKKFTKFVFIDLAIFHVLESSKKFTSVMIQKTLVVGVTRNRVKAELQNAIQLPT